MKKRLLCLFLCLVMVLAMIMTSCSKDEEESADVDEDMGAQTITMRLVSEKKVCNTEEELAAYLANECGGNEDSQKYQDMLETVKTYNSVEAEFTKITKSKYKINVDLMFYTEEEYFDMLTDTMEKYAQESKIAQLAERTLKKYVDDYIKAYPELEPYKSAIENEFYKYYPEYEKYRGYSSEDEELSAFEEQYKENELGIKELVYPETEDNQLDIIYISGYDMYMEYVEKEWITALDEQISTTGRKLNDYISAALLNGVKVDGSTYAIPNNIEIGEYTYMLIDKDLFDSLHYSYDNVESLLDCRHFLADVVKAYPDVLPIDASFDDCMKQFVWYWNIDWRSEVNKEEKTTKYYYTINTENKFNVVGALYGDPAKAGRGQLELGFNSLFTLPEYREIFLCLKEYEMNGCYPVENETREGAAISFVNGNYSIKRSALENEGVYVDEDGKQYYAVVVKYPEADEHSLYGNMFAVSENSKNVQGCMQILTLLNTNSELRNVLQYGIEGEHYEIDEETLVLKRLNNDYVMDLEKTGNCFIAHPEEGLAADYWENSKKQNNDALINPLLGFDFDAELADYDAKLDNSLMKNISILTEQTLEKINACETYEELYELVQTEELGLCFTLDPANSPTILIPGYKDPVGVRLTKICDKAYDTATGGGVDGSGNRLPDEDGESPYTIYYNWLVTYGFVPAS